MVPSSPIIYLYFLNTTRSTSQIEQRLLGWQYNDGSNKDEKKDRKKVETAKNRSSAMKNQPAAVKYVGKVQVDLLVAYLASIPKRMADILPVGHGTLNLQVS